MPKTARLDLLVLKRYYSPHGVRCCSDHLLGTCLSPDCEIETENRSQTTAKLPPKELLGLFNDHRRLIQEATTAPRLDFLDPGLTDEDYQVFTDLGYEVKMPYYLEKGNKQHTTLEVHESRSVTKVRWTVESFHARFKSGGILAIELKIKCFLNSYIVYCIIRIISACLHCYRGTIIQNYNSLEIQAVAAAMKDRKGKCNTLLALIETGKISARQRWSEIDEANIDFPLMDLDDLRLLFFESYQIKQSIKYAEE
ncbi:unnamed protein product, partial [Didymodactylos carnosus]